MAVPDRGLLEGMWDGWEDLLELTLVDEDFLHGTDLVLFFESV